MKKLCLFRHAKSTWGEFGTDDQERPLHPTGEENAPLMGGFLKDQKLKPDLMLTSNAIRAQRTAEFVAEPLGYDKEKIVIREDLYEAGVEDLLHICQGLDKKIENVILIGHNPGLTLLANYLADTHVPNLATCGVFCMEFDADDWGSIETAESRVLFTDEPSKHELS